MSLLPSFLIPLWKTILIFAAVTKILPFICSSCSTCTLRICKLYLTEHNWVNFTASLDLLNINRYPTISSCKTPIIPGLPVIPLWSLRLCSFPTPCIRNKNFLDQKINSTVFTVISVFLNQNFSLLHKNFVRFLQQWTPTLKKVLKHYYHLSFGKFFTISLMIGW